MGKAERIEDLGKLAVMIDDMRSSQLFVDLPWSRAKDAYDGFSSLNEEEKCDCIHNIAYGLLSLNEKLCDCLVIANGNYED